MTRHDDAVRLRHMLDHAAEAVEMCRGRQKKDLNDNRQFCLAMTHLVEIVGEAAAHVSQETQDRYPAIPWAGVISLRNRLVHGYDKVDLNILWDILQDDLSELIVELKKALGE